MNDCTLLKNYENINYSICTKINFRSGQSDSNRETNLNNNNYYYLLSAHLMHVIGDRFDVRHPVS